MKSPLPRIPTRAADSHKGSFGHVYIVGGSMGMAGAVAIAGMSALRSGAGLVTCVVPSSIQSVVAGFQPCYTTLGLECSEDGLFTSNAVDAIVQATRRAACIGFGPGLGRSDDIRSLARILVREATCPLIIDADGINALSEVDLKERPNETAIVVTPHPGEMERLGGAPRTDRSLQIAAAKELAIKCRIVVVLKGHRTFVTDGQQSFENRTGNAKMASGGSGDCLTGMIAALIAQGLTSCDAAVLGVAIHGTAGDIAARRLGSPSVLATDLIEDLPSAFLWAEENAADESLNNSTSRYS